MPIGILSYPEENNCPPSGIQKFLLSATKDELALAQHALSSSLASLENDVSYALTPEACPTLEEAEEIQMTCSQLGLDAQANHVSTWRDDQTGQLYLFITNAGFFHALRRVFVEEVEDPVVSCLNGQMLQKLEAAINEELSALSACVFSTSKPSTSSEVARKYRTLLQLYFTCGLDPYAGHVVFWKSADKKQVLPRITVAGLRDALRPQLL